MPISDEHHTLLSDIRGEWNKAEENIKLAEQVCSKVVMPAIKELRYAGRRIVDALYYMNGVECDDNRVKDLLNDAKFDCLRARHDAIDVATAKMAIDMETMVKELKYSVILNVYPDFHKLKKALDDARSNIAKSRGHREDRERIYTNLEVTSLPEIVTMFNDMMSRESIMKEFAVAERKSILKNNLGFYFGIVGSIAGVIGTIAAVIAIYK